MKNGEISLSKFLSRFVNLEGKCLTKVTHDEVKRLFPDLKRCSFDEVYDHQELVESGKIVMVNDGKKVIPYYVPSLDQEEVEYLEFNREEVRQPRMNNRCYDYSSMSVYELKQLLERRFNSCLNQRTARRELNNRGYALKRKYDRNKFKGIIEE